MEAKSILLINAGMRKNGSSASFARTFKMIMQESGNIANIVHILDLYEDEKSIEKLENLISKHDIIGMFIPTYVNTLPYPVLLCMERLADKGVRFEGKKFFAIAQGGMPYLNVHQPVLNTCKHFANEMGMKWQGGVICELAPIIDGADLEKAGFLGKRMIRSFKYMLKYILSGEKIPNRAQGMLTMKMPSILSYPLSAFLNFLFKKELKKKGITDINPKPYLR